MIHELKCWPEYYQAVFAGVKTFDLRYDDRGFAVWDYLRLREYDPATGEYTGRDLLCEVRYLLRDIPHLAPGYVAMAIVVMWETTG